MPKIPRIHNLILTDTLSRLDIIPTWHSLYISYFLSIIFSLVYHSLYTRQPLYPLYPQLPYLYQNPNLRKAALYHNNHLDIIYPAALIFSISCSGVIPREPAAFCEVSTFDWISLYIAFNSPNSIPCSIPCS